VDRARQRRRLGREWIGLAFVNPPYSAIATWSDKIIEEAAREIEIILAGRRPPGLAVVLPARLVERGRRVLLARPAAFDSAVVYHGPRPWGVRSRLRGRRKGGETPMILHVDWPDGPKLAVSREDAALISAAPELLARALAEIERQRTRVAELEASR